MNLYALQNSIGSWPCGASSPTSMPHQKKHVGRLRKLHLLLVCPCNVKLPCLCPIMELSAIRISAVRFFPNFYPAVLHLKVPKWKLHLLLVFPCSTKWTCLCSIMELAAILIAEAFFYRTSAPLCFILESQNWRPLIGVWNRESDSNSS